MTNKDLQLRMNFAKKAKKLLQPDFWESGVSFYLDAVGFTYKTNPCDQARSPGAMLWRRANEGLEVGCTAKGQKEGTKQVHFICAISHGKGVICCEQYEGKMSGELFANFVDENFEQVFQKSCNPRAKRFLQDGCPSQNSKRALASIDQTNAKLFSIPPRSPDLNPIENVFHLVKKRLQSDAVDNNITHETHDRFVQRVKDTLCQFPIDIIDRTIESMDKRIALVLKRKGQRIKY